MDIRRYTQIYSGIVRDTTCTRTYSDIHRHAQIYSEMLWTRYGILCTKADSTRRSSQAVPHPSTNRALCRLTSEVRRDPVHSTRYGRQRKGKVNVSIVVLLCEVAPCNTDRGPHTSDLQEDSTNQATSPQTPGQTDTPSRQKQEEARHTTHDERRTTTNEGRKASDEGLKDERPHTHTQTERTSEQRGGRRIGKEAEEHRRDFPSGPPP